MDKKLPPLATLRSFVVAAREESFSSAADILCLTPSAVSHQIKVLETFLGRRLFTRTQHRMVLTEQGALYAQRIGLVFQDIEKATEALLQPDQSSRLMVKVAPSLAGSWLVPLLADFIRKHPSIQIQLITYSTASPEPEVDCEIRYGHGKWPNVETELLWTERLQPMVAQQNTSIRSMSDLAQAVLIHTRSRARGWKNFFGKYAPSTQTTTTQDLLFDRTGLAIEAACAGLGVALESPVLARKLLREGVLKMPLPEVGIDDEAYFFVTAPGKASDQAERFKQWIRENVPRTEAAKP